MAKKRIILVLLISLVGSLVFGTGMPVIDISAITQAITNALQEAQRWEQQIKQWQSEYDKAKKAVEGITSGDFTAVVSGIASLSGQLASISSQFSWAESSLWDERFDDVSDASYSLLDLMSHTELLVQNYDKIVDTFQENLAKTMSITDSYDSATSLLNTTGTMQFDQIYNLLKNGGSMVVDGAEIVNSVADLFKISPKEAAQIYESSLNKSLKAAGYNSLDEVNEKIAELYKEYNDLETERLNYSTEDVQALSELDASEDNISSQIAQLEKLKTSYKNGMETVVSIKSNQGTYEEQQQEEVIQSLKTTSREAKNIANEYRLQYAQEQEQKILNEINSSY
jgi:hypothetical protein